MFCVWILCLFVVFVLVGAHIEHSRIVDQRDAVFTFRDVIEIAVAVFHVVAKDVVAWLIVVLAPHGMDHVNVFAIERIHNGRGEQQVGSLLEQDWLLKN